MPSPGGAERLGLSPSETQGYVEKRLTLMLVPFVDVTGERNIPSQIALGVADRSEQESSTYPDLHLCPLCPARAPRRRSPAGQRPTPRGRLADTAGLVEGVEQGGG